MKLKPPLLCVLLLTIFGSNSCKKDEPAPKVNIQFKNASLSVTEGAQSSITLVLDKATQKQEFVSIQFSSAAAVYGSDFSIDNSVNINNTFSVSIPKDSSSVSFAFLAIGDYVAEADETVHFQIMGTSDGISLGSTSSTDVTIKDQLRYPAADNRAISFDGIDDYIDLGNIYDDLVLPVTISAWVYIDPAASTVAAFPIFASQDGLPIYDGIEFNAGNNSSVSPAISFIGVQYGDGQGENNSAYRRAKTGSISPAAGRWVNMTAIIRGATDMDTYLNGVNVGGTYAGSSNLPMHSASPTEHAKIGILTQNNTIQRFQGKLDELKIWNRALTESEIQKIG